MNARALVLSALQEWRTGRRFADAILQPSLTSSGLSDPDRGFATELFYGVLRNLTLLDFWIGRLRSAPLDDVARDLLRIGLYQIFLLRTPGHAAVFETVALASARRRPPVNGILRTAQRQLPALEAAAHAAPLAVRYSHPDFLVARWQCAFGDAATTAFCVWNNQPAPVYARVNSLRLTREQFLAQHPAGTPVAATADFVRLDRLPLDALHRGECYIQDPSTRLACELLAPQPGQDVLDACAAPGGKSSYLAALMEDRGRLIACDRDSSRVQTLSGNLERLGVTNAHVLRHDWLSEQPLEGDIPATFDRILLDVPCTNTGVMQRRVDVRWRLRPDDFVRMSAEQQRITRAVLPFLKPGGTLVYSTCSVEEAENEQVVSATLQEFPFLELTGQSSTLPFRDGFDGAFAARFLRTS